MTTHDFLRVLATTPRDWRVEGGRIRRGTPTLPDCPLTVVARYVREGASGGRGPEAPGLRLDPETLTGLVAAMDNLPGADPRLRARLLKACGLPIKPGDRGRPATG
jgi:hypothetical protein